MRDYFYFSSLYIVSIWEKYHRMSLLRVVLINGYTTGREYESGMNLRFFFYKGNILEYFLIGFGETSTNLSMIQFVFRKNVKTRTKTGYRMIIFSGKCVVSFMCSARAPLFPLPVPKKNITYITLILLLLLFTITIITAYSLIAATRLSCQLCCCYHTIYPCAAIFFFCSFFLYISRRRRRNSNQYNRLVDIVHFA